jgi:dihydroorotate dehydrogenase electron transfer subunit
VRIAWATVIESERLYGDTRALWLHAPEVVQGAAPGQFLMLRCNDAATSDGERNVAATFRSPLPGPHEGHGGLKLASSSLGHTEITYGPPMLPRPMSYHRLRPAQGGGHDFAILLEVIGPGTQWLSRRQPGDRILAYGPLGRGYAIRRGAGNLLLVAGGIGVAPLVWLADEQVARGRHVTLIQGARSADGLFPARLLPPEVEVVAVTEDGSMGQRGLVTDLVPDYLSWADQVFACGPNAMFRALADVVRRCEGEGARRRRKPVQVLLEEVMPCGTGICYGCAVMTRRGVRLICKDGPRFELRDVFW